MANEHPTSRNSAVVDFQSVSFAYDRGNVLEDVNFSILAGDFASMVGPNGGGKTTLVKLILGLISPSKGTVRLFGEPPRKSRIRVGYTPQFIHVDFSFPLCVNDVVLMGRLGVDSAGSRKGLFGFFKTRYGKIDREAAEAALETMRIADMRDVPFSELSGGQRQRVLIARALCGNPELLLLDEPTSNIDPSSEEILYEILDELNKRLTIMLVSHDIGLVSQFVKSVICVNRNVAVHPTSELNGTLVSELYGGGVNIVRHDHRCVLKDCECK